MTIGDVQDQDQGDGERKGGGPIQDQGNVQEVENGAPGVIAGEGPKAPIHETVEEVALGHIAEKDSIGGMEIDEKKEVALDMITGEMVGKEKLNVWKDEKEKRKETERENVKEIGRGKKQRTALGQRRTEMIK